MQVYFVRLSLWLIILSTTIFEFSCALHCIHCDSTRDKNCAIEPDDANIDIVTCPGLDKCAMSIVGEITYRGCSSDIPVGKDYYRTCDKLLCNHQIWPPGRQKCFQCEGEGCVKKQAGKAKPCLNFIEEDGCFTDILDEKNAIRGCKSDNKKLSPNAVHCKYNSCNNENGIQERKCLQCNDKKTGCKRVQPDITKKCILNEGLHSNCTVEYLLGRENQTCFIYHHLNQVERGCTKDRPDLAADKEHLLECDGDNCNNVCLNATQCVSCSTKDEPKCKSESKDLVLSTCSFEQSSCYAKVHDDGEIERDCGYPFDKKNSYVCDENGCNTKNFRKCYNCSSENDPNCSQLTNFDILNQEICEYPDSDCLTLVTMDGHTVRGCRNANFDCKLKNQACQNCTGNLCNSEIFPESRPKCHQCQNSEVCNRDQNSNGKPIPCTNYNSNDECIQFLNDKNHIIRGCKSDLVLYDKCKNENEKCLKCNGEGCNHQKISEKPTLSCHTCDDNEPPKGACAWTQKNHTLVKCQKNVMFYETESCFVHANSRKQVSRGCTLDNAKILMSHAENNQVKKCDSIGCNHDVVFEQNCVQCQSNVTGMENCKSKAEGIESKKCEQIEQYFEKRGCFIRVDGNGIVTRGCSFSLTNEELNACVKSDLNCKHCKNDNCNIVKAPEFFGGTSSITQNYWILGITLVLGVAIAQ